MAEENKVDLSAFFAVKSGMTRIFDEAGNSIPVTVVKIIPNTISQVKTKEKDGYEAYQITYGEKRERLINKPTKGHLAKAKIEKAFTKFTEIKVDKANQEDLGKQLGINHFTPATYLDITGISKGKGVQGVMKRFNFIGGPAAHGSHFHRRPGSIGCRATPGRVTPEKKMPGRMGNEKTTIQNVLLQEVNIEKGYLLIKGSVPGGKNGVIKISKALKK